MKFLSKLALLLVVLVVALWGVRFDGAAKAVESEQRSQFVPPIMIVNTSFLNVRVGPGTQYAILMTVVGGTELPVLGTAGDGVWYQVSTSAGPGWLNSEFAIARGDFSNVPVVDAPEMETFNPSTLMDEASGQVGSSTSGAPAATSPTGRAWGLSVVIDHPARTQPTINASSPGTAPENRDRIYPILDSASGPGAIWYLTELPQLGRVWVESGKTLLRPYACDMTAVQMRTVAFPDVGPDGSGTLNGNVRLEVGEEAYLIDNIGRQYKIELFDGSTGWVDAGAVAVRDEAISSEFCAGVVPSESAVTDDTGTGAEAPQQQALRSPARVVINTGFLNIRTGPGSQYTVLATVPGGTELDVTGFAPDGVWYRVRGTFGTGWLNSEFTIFRGNGTNIPIVRDVAGELARPIANITNAVTLYTAPNASSAVVSVLSGPVEAPIVARTPDNGWVQLSTSAGFGWVRPSQVSLSGDLNLAPVVNS